MEIVYKNYNSYIINNHVIDIFANEVNGIRQTIAQIGDIYYHIGNEVVGMSTAITAYEEFFQLKLTDEELQSTLIKNKIISEKE